MSNLRTIRIPHPQALWGNALHVAWGWLVFSGSLFASPEGDLIDLAFLPDSLYTISLFANAATLFALSLALRTKPMPSSRATALCAALLMSSGTFLGSNFVGALLGSPTFLVEVLAGLFTGMGSALFLLLWGEVLASYGTRDCLVCFAAASAIAAACHILLRLFPSPLVQALMIIAPLAELAFFRSCATQESSDSANEGGKGAPLPSIVVFICVFFGFSFGAVRALTDSSIGGTGIMSHELSMLFVIVGCLLAYAVAVKRKNEFGQLTYQIALPLVAIGFLLLPYSGIPSLFGTALYRVGYQYVYVILWAIFTHASGKPGTRPTWVFAYGLSAIQLSKLLGFVACADLAVALGPSFDLGLISQLALFCIAIFALFSQRESLEDDSWKKVRPASETANPSMEELLAPSFDRYGLTSREAEVLLLTLKGRTRTHIAKELVIGEETVKSHMKHIYQKTGVHTKQDLIDLMEAEARSRE